MENLKILVVEDDPGTLLVLQKMLNRAGHEVISVFMKDAPVQLGQLRQALNDNDAERVRQQAHRIKGASANIGAQALSDLAFEIETAGKDAKLDVALPLVGKLEEDFEKLGSVLSDFDECV